MLSRFLLAAINVYRCCFSPLMGPHCRFHPSCSAYAAEAIDQYGPGRGTVLTLRRLMRCHPWHPGGHDPVPSRPLSSRDCSETVVPAARTGEI